MKKFLALVLTLAIALTSFSLTALAAKEDDVTVRVAGLKGPTSMGMVSLMEYNEFDKSENDYEFTIAGSADEITPKLIKGELDIAAVPANLGSVLYNKTKGEIKLLAINTLGVLYIVSTDDTVKTVADLKGKTIVGSGKGSTPEYSLKYILKENGLKSGKDVKLEWKSEHTEVVQYLIKNPGAVALLPQPFVTVAQSQIKDLKIRLDLTKEWKKLGTGSDMITGVMVVRKDFYEKYPKTVKKFLDEYNNSVYYTNNSIDQAAKLIEEYGIIKASVAKEAIPYCNIVCISGSKMKKNMQGYLQVLYDADPKSIGGKLPGDDYYIE